MAILRFVEKAKNYLLDIFFPIKCFGCGLKDKVLCDNCVAKIPQTERETENGIIALFDYRDPLVKKIIWELKYHHKRYIGEKLGKILYEYLLEEVSEMKNGFAGNKIIVVPVPISTKKTKIRGYNQALSIARGFCGCQNKIFEIGNDIVGRSVERTPQARITDRKKRLENVKGVFILKKKEKVAGRTIIIIDDVTTTGGTISEIMKILKNAGASKVVGFAVAH